MKFEDFSLDSRILKRVKAAGYETPTPIQQQAIPHVLDGRDVMGLAQTGTGKTAAFILPTIQHLTTGPLRKVRALVVAPTRELAEQIHQEAVKLGRDTKIRSTAIYGGVGKGPQVSRLRQGSEIVVACPGRLLDLANERQIDLSHVEVLILDEADRMFDMGFLPDIRRIVKLVPKARQNLLFSATMPKDIRQLADEILVNPVTVQIDRIAPAKTVSHALYSVPEALKRNMLFHMIDTTATGRVIIFTRTKYRARNLARDLEKRGLRATALQGNMSQNQRQRSINGFREGKFDILAATDIAARGIDISDVSHVINFDIPDTVDAYTHRIGRTGRAEQTGEAFTLVSQLDGPMVRDIERALGTTIERRELDGFDYEEFDPFAPLPKNPPKRVQGGNRGGGRGRNNNQRGGGGQRGAGGQPRNGRASNNRANRGGGNGSGNRRQQSGASNRKS